MELLSLRDIDNRFEQIDGIFKSYDNQIGSGEKYRWVFIMKFEIPMTRQEYNTIKTLNAEAFGDDAYLGAYYYRPPYGDGDGDGDARLLPIIFGREFDLKFTDDDFNEFWFIGGCSPCNYCPSYSLFLPDGLIVDLEMYLIDDKVIEIIAFFEGHDEFGRFNVKEFDADKIMSAIEYSEIDKYETQILDAVMQLEKYEIK